MIGRRLKFILVAVCGLSAATACAQKYPERRIARQGNEAYNDGEYSQSEIKYRKALELDPALQEAQFNLGDALYKQQRYEESAQLFARLAADSSASDAIRAASFFNEGNALFQQKKYPEALEAYKSSLRIDPTDMEAKFNLAYTKKMMEQEQNQGQGQNQNQNQDQNQNQNQNQDQDQNQNQDQNSGDQSDPNKDSENDKRNPNDRRPGSKNPEQKQGDGGEPKVDRSEAERMLDAVQGEEDKTREKVNAKKGAVVGRSGKNW